VYLSYRACRVVSDFTKSVSKPRLYCSLYSERRRQIARVPRDMCESTVGLSSLRYSVIIYRPWTSLLFSSGGRTCGLDC